MNIGIGGERRRMTGFGHRLSGRLSNAFARLAEESSTVEPSAGTEAEEPGAGTEAEA